MTAAAAWEVPAVLLAQRGEPVRVETITILAPGPDEVAVRLLASGLCRTDLAAVRDARTVPVVLGHEGAGCVEALGSNVQHLRRGDHVVINWQAKCGSCWRCHDGRSDLCDSILSTAQPRLHWQGRPVTAMLNAGTFCPVAVVPAGGAVRIPPEVPFSVAAMLGCAVATGLGAALYTTRVHPGEAVAVIGAGAVGLNIIQGAKLAQAGIIIAVDREPSRLALAETLGATHTVSASGAELTSQVRDITRGRGAEHVFEAVGAPEMAAEAIDMLARGGTLTLVGAASREALLSFAPRRFMSQQQTIRGCIYGNIQPARDLPLFARWYLEGRIEIDAFLGDRTSLAELPKYFAADGPSRSRAVRTTVELC